MILSFADSAQQQQEQYLATHADKAINTILLLVGESIELKWTPGEQQAIPCMSRRHHGVRRHVLPWPRACVLLEVAGVTCILCTLHGCRWGCARGSLGTCGCCRKLLTCSPSMLSRLQLAPTPAPPAPAPACQQPVAT